MKNIILNLIVLFLLTVLIYGSRDIQAQGLFKATHIHNAYDKKTRNDDGNPGLNYWMNRSNYNIDVEVDPKNHKLIGSEKIRYFNNSPDTLDRIVLRLYMDLFKNGNKRNIEISPEACTDGVTIQNIKVDGLEYVDDSSNLTRDGTNLIISLQKLIIPQSSIEISLNWSYTIPTVTKIRTGVYDSTSHFVSLWYPQISVYDDIDGWDLLQYTGLQEFYNDYNDYDVNISVPKEFVVWATGTQSNIEETLTDEYVERITKSSSGEFVRNIITEIDREKANITKYRVNTWKFTAKQVPDFAFAISDTYLWDLKPTIISLESDKTILVSAAYDKTSKDFYEVTDIAAQAIKEMANNLPGIIFPYDNVTIFNSDGDSGMEFPMIINDGSFTNRSRTAGITSHELLHQYFPFYVGTNERKYAWMDEGWARMMQFDIQESIEPSFNKKASIVAKYSNVGKSEYDVPLMVPSTLFDAYGAYKTHAYTRPAMALLSLKEYKGKEKFKEALKEFIIRWKHKHPTPYDFFNTFNAVYNEDLSWFWKPWFFEFGNADLGIKTVSIGKSETIIAIENVGRFPLPVKVNIIYNSGVQKTYTEGSGVWKNKKIFELKIKNTTGINKIELGSINVPDVDNSNNIFMVNQ